MKFSLRTRSRDRDYRFVGLRPDPWWNTGDIGRLFSAESPALAVRRSGADRQVLFTGIPSDRKDIHDRAIRFTVLAESSAGDTDGEISALFRAVTVWLEGCHSAQAETNQLTQLLRRRLTEAEVERWFSADLEGGSEAASHSTEIDVALRECFNEILPEPDAPGVDVQHGCSYGGLRNVSARHGFRAFVGSLLRSPSSVRGIALVAPNFHERSELLHTLELLAELDRHSLFVLLDDALGVEQFRPKGPEAAPPPPAQDSWWHGVMGLLRRQWVWILAVALLVGMILSRR